MDPRDYDGWIRVLNYGAEVALVRHGEDAAALMAVLGDECEARVGSVVLWREGREEFGAGEYDRCADTMLERWEAAALPEAQALDRQIAALQIKGRL